GQAHAVDRDRALLDEVGPHGARRAEAVGEPVAVRRDRVQAADAVDMALHDVAAQTVAELERPLDVQATAERQPAERRARARRQRFELAAVEPDAPARRTLVDGHVLIRDGREGLGATRTAEAVRRLLVTAETREELAIALGEEAVLVRLLLLMELVAEPVLLIRHGGLPSPGGPRGACPPQAGRPRGSRSGAPA